MFREVFKYIYILFSGHFFPETIFCSQVIIYEKNSLRTIEERPTLSALSRSAERMRGSSRRETALELALKVGR